MVPIAEELISQLALNKVLVVEHCASFVLVGRVAESRSPTNSREFLLFGLLRVEYIAILSAGRRQSSLFGRLGQVVTSSLAVVLIADKRSGDMLAMRAANSFVPLLHQASLLFGAGIGIEAESSSAGGSRLV